MMSLMEFVSICGVATLTAAGASQGFSAYAVREQRSDPQTGLADEEVLRTTVPRGMARTPSRKAAHGKLSDRARVGRDQV